MKTYLKAYMIHKKDNCFEKTIFYPEQIRSNIGAKVLFDIIAPEVGSRSYTYSPYKMEIRSAVAEDLFDTEIENKIVRFIEKIIMDYVEITHKKSLSDEESIMCVKKAINEWEFQEIKGCEECIAEALRVLY